MKHFSEGELVRLARFRSRSKIPTSNVDALILKVRLESGWRHYKLKYNGEKGGLLKAWHREDVVSERTSNAVASIKDKKSKEELKIQRVMNRFRKLLQEKS